MRFHLLETENLTALHGVQRVAFDGPLGEAGLFLIHGPTGAGKSTILDAICLALYGQTPRLGATGATAADGAEEGASDESATRVMSHGAGTCRAVVEVSILDEQGARARFRASWSVARAHRKPEGKFQAPERALEEWVDGTWRTLVRSTKKSDWTAPFGRLLRGLTFDDFQRSVMLAQFKFREFLDADRSARTQILERMTDTGRFRAIGAAAAQARTDADRAVKQLETALDAVALLDEVARAEHEAALAGADAEAASAIAAVSACQRAEAYLDQLLSVQGRWEQARAAHDAAEEARNAQTQVLAALARDEALAPAREAHGAVVALEAARAEALEKRDAARATRDAAEAEHGNAAQALAVAEEALVGACAERGARMPEVVAAEDAWRAVEEATRASEGLASAARAAEARATLDQETHAAAVRDHDTTVAALAGVDGRLADIPGHARLRTDLGSVERLAEEVGGHDVRVTRAAETVATRASDLTTHGESRDPRVRDVGASEAAVASARAREADAARGLEAFTGGRPVEDVRAGLDATRDAAHATLAAIERATARAADLERVAARHGESSRGLEAAQAAERLAHDAAEAAESRTGAQREAVHTLAELVEATAALLGAARYRAVLVEGEPCPVCGGDEHPWRLHPDRAPSEEAHAARHADARARHAAASETLVRLAETSEGAVRALAVARAAASAAGSTLAERAAERATLEGEVEGLDRAAGIPAGADPAAREAAAERARTDLAGAVERARALRVEEDAVRAASQDVMSSAATQREATLALEAHDAKAALLDTSLADARADEACARTERDAARQALAGALAALEVASEDLAAGVALVRRRAAEVGELTRERETLALRVQGAQDARTRAQVAAEHTLGAARVARAAAEAAQGALGGLRAAAEGLLGGAVPATIRAALEATVKAAEGVVSDAQKGLADAGARVAAALATLEERVGACAAVDARLADAVALRARRLAEAGLEGVDALLAGSLDDAARAAAVATRARVIEDCRAAAVRLEEAERARTAHLATRPDGVAEDADPGEQLPAVRAALAAEQARATDANQRVGTLRGILAQDDAARATHAERAQALARAREDAGHWREIHALIGVNDGERFATVVQALNLRRVLAHANEHLQRFMPRYELQQVLHREQGPLLDFRVLDHHSQGCVRSVRSMSGGESFIVSLALALGLASTRASRLRIETLLIDEGFGSLDPQTLATATAALTALQAAVGVRIGVISHVEHLREVIPAQIVVEPQGAGRSRVRVVGAT